jgi:thioredoxin reductase (NADPH)
VIRSRGVDEIPDAAAAYPSLDRGQIAVLRESGEERATQVGDVLYREGDHTSDFHVILRGQVALVQQQDDGEEREISVHGPGRFLGELNLLTGQAVFETAVVREAGAVLVLPTDRLRELLARDPELGDVILRAYLVRRSILVDLGLGFSIIGSRYSADTHRLREFAARNRLPHRWCDLEEDPATALLLRRVGVEPRDTPVVLWAGRLLRNPTNDELARVVGLRGPVLPQSAYDIVVVGAGPAGLAVAVYGASEGLDTLVLDAVATGGQAATSSRIENYLGFPSGISGAELADRALLQAERFGACVSVPARVCALERADGHHAVRLDDGTTVPARTVVVASGARYRKPDVPGLARFEGVSVYYAATHLEARSCRGDPVVVLGGGNSAGQATVFLARTAASVHLVLRSDDLATDMSRYLADRIERMPSVTVHRHTELREVRGDQTLRAVILEDIGTGEQAEVPALALFVFIGAEPHADWVGNEIARDDRGFVVTGPGLETTCPGVFAVGDVRSGSVKRVAAAVGEGAMVVRFIHEHLDDRGRLPPAPLAL